MSINNDITISFKPTAEELNEIENWLIKEDAKSDQGFYCNWQLILNSNAKDKIAILIHKKKAIGFVTWEEYEHYGVIYIAEIKPTQRKKGFGKILIDALFHNFLKKEILIVKLHCEPYTTEKVWKKLGFIDFPDVRAFMSYNHKVNKHLYKVLAPHAEPIINDDSEETLELWNDEPIYVGNTEPTWSWSLKFEANSRKLVAPIIVPCHYDWKLKWTKGNTVMKDDKVKRFSKEVDFGDFMIIT